MTHRRLESPAGDSPARAASDTARRSIGLRLAFAFGVVATLAIFMCLGEYLLVLHAMDLISGMQDLERGSASSTRLAIAVREEYLHQVHWIVDRDPAHLEHAREYGERARQAIETLKTYAQPDGVERLEMLEKQTRELATLFEDEVRPAVSAGEVGLVQRHHDTMNRLAQEMGAEADRIAALKAHRMAEMHARAIRATHRAAWSAVICIVSVLLVSTYFVVRLNRAIARPIKRLAHTAGEVARGDFHVRIGAPMHGELGILAGAFDRMAQELAAREERLIRSERMAAIGQLAAGVAHEINNPIGIIRGYLSTMSPESPPEQLVEEIRILDEEAAACQRLVNDLLGFSRTSTLRRTDVDMGRLLARTVERVQETPAASGLSIAVDARPALLRVDEGRMRQVVLNLLGNALGASPPDGVVEVTGAPAPDGGYAFTVADHGPGIPPEYRTRVFEPFFSTSAAGSGLGLAICREIVRAHGGTIAIRGRDGNGTVVEVVLPGPDGETSDERAA